MPVAMEVNLDDPSFVNSAITGDGLAVPQGQVGADEPPALIAVRLRWHRRFRKDRSLDYNEEELRPSGIVHLRVRYALSPGERKTAFVEIVNTKNGSKLKSERRLFEGPPILP